MTQLELLSAFVRLLKRIKHNPTPAKIDDLLITIQAMALEITPSVADEP
jgi:hypothetical protein